MVKNYTEWLSGHKSSYWDYFDKQFSKYLIQGHHLNLLRQNIIDRARLYNIFAQDKISSVAVRRKKSKQEDWNLEHLTADENQDIYAYDRLVVETT